MKSPKEKLSPDSIGILKIKLKGQILEINRDKHMGKIPTHFGFKMTGLKECDFEGNLSIVNMLNPYIECDVWIMLIAKQKKVIEVSDDQNSLSG